MWYYTYIYEHFLKKKNEKNELYLLFIYILVLS